MTPERKAEIRTTMENASAGGFSSGWYDTSVELLDALDEAEVKLSSAKVLSGLWRELGETHWYHARNNCADELEEALKDKS